MPVIVVGEVPDASVKHDCQLLVRFSPCLVIVKQTMDTPVPVQYIYGFRHIGGGVENDIILPVRFGMVRQFLFLNVRKGDSPSCPRIPDISPSVLPTVGCG